LEIDADEMNRRLVRLAESSDASFWRLDYNELSRPEQVFRAIWELEAQVNNGGFHQYFLNSGTLVPHIVDALRVIGADQMADIVQHAIDVVGRDIAWKDDNARLACLGALVPEATAELESCDQRFFAYPDSLTTRSIVTSMSIEAISALRHKGLSL
jgi:hypothetical protein